MSGPWFLLLYALLFGVCAVALLMLRRMLEAGPLPRLRAVDPYLVAMLRGGPNEAIRVTAFSLLDRGLLAETDRKLMAVADVSHCAVRPLERALLVATGSARAPHELLANADLHETCRALEDELIRLQLLPGPELRARRRRLWWGFAAFLIVVSAVRIESALLNGHRNVGFLLVLTVASVLLLRMLASPRRTALGDRVLDDLRTLFAGLERRASRLAAGGGTHEVSLLIGVFGLSALEGELEARAQRLFAGTGANTLSSLDSSGSSCGSSSSGGSSCGGGCGGGGCGGCGS